MIKYDDLKFYQYIRDPNDVVHEDWAYDYDIRGVDIDWAVWPGAVGRRAVDACPSSWRCFMRLRSRQQLRNMAKKQLACS